MIPDFSAFMTNHPYIAAIVTLAIGWLVRHRGFGQGLLPSLTPATDPAKPAPAPAPASTISARSIENMIAAPRSLTAGDVRSAIAAELDAREAQAAGPSPIEAAHAVVSLMSDHPDQQAALAPVVTALTAKAAKKE